MLAAFVIELCGTVGLYGAWHRRFPSDSWNVIRFTWLETASAPLLSDLGAAPIYAYALPLIAILFIAFRDWKSSVYSVAIALSAALCFTWPLHCSFNEIGTVYIYVIPLPNVLIAAVGTVVFVLRNRFCSQVDIYLGYSVLTASVLRILYLLCALWMGLFLLDPNSPL